MFNLDKEIRLLLRQLNNKSLISRPCLDELENHIRDEIDELVSKSTTAEEAFKQARSSFGDLEAFVCEFGKLYGDSKYHRIKNYLSYYFDGRVIMRVLIGMATCSFFIVSGLLLEGGHISSMVQLTAFLIVVGGAVGALIITYPPSIVFKSFVLAITGRQAVRSAYLDAAKVFKSFGDLSILTGIVGVIFGSIHVLENLTEETLHLTGPGFAVALVSALYGVLARLFIGKPLHESFMFKVYPSEEVFQKPNFPDEDQRLTA